jgi:hypothetical protein
MVMHEWQQINHGVFTTVYLSQLARADATLHVW